MRGVREREKMGEGQRKGDQREKGVKERKREEEKGMYICTLIHREG